MLRLVSIQVAQESHKQRSPNQLIMVSANTSSLRERSACQICPLTVIVILPQECSYINTHVTAPGAIVALGLAFLKTNDKY